MKCQLCEGSNAHIFFREEKRDRAYYQCLDCEFVFLDPKHHLSLSDQKFYYDQHENFVGDPNYCHFLSQVLKPFQEFAFSRGPRAPLEAQAFPKLRTLDFGCGPGPALQAMLVSAGHLCELYDPIYAPDLRVFRTAYYDAIFATEVMEHLPHPLQTLQELSSCLKPKGAFFIMTKLLQDEIDFGSWHYRMDETHVSFFRRTSLSLMAQRLSMKLEIYGNRVIVFAREAL